MSKNLEEKFRSFCNSKNLEINQNQIATIKLLQDFYNKNFHFSIFILLHFIEYLLIKSYVNRVYVIVAMLYL